MTSGSSAKLAMIGIVMQLSKDQEPSAVDRTETSGLSRRKYEAGFRLANPGVGCDGAEYELRPYI
jgi:hypothetical protein